MVEFAARIARSHAFQAFIVAVILFAGVLVGIETYPSAVEAYGPLLHTLDAVVLWIFVGEIVIKMLAHGRHFYRYVRDPWNVFDFSIVAVCFLPLDTRFVAVLRLARILRVLRLVTQVPKLQLLVGALLKALPSMGYVSALLGLLFYIYACVGVTLFGANDPVHFGNLQLALLSLFRIVTLEDWTDLMYIAMYGCANYGYSGIEHLCDASYAAPVVGALYFVSFVLLGTMIILNLFIGVIMNSMDEAQKEQAIRHHDGSLPKALAAEIVALESRLADFRDQLAHLHVYTRGESIGEPTPPARD